MSVTAPAATRPSNWNLPNALTVLRILLVPVMGVLLVHDAGQDPWWRVGALAVFVLAIATDRVDGEIARRQNLVTDFGKVADPIADKALVGTTLVLLSVLGLAALVDHRAGDGPRDRHHADALRRHPARGDARRSRRQAQDRPAVGRAGLLPVPHRAVAGHLGGRDRVGR